MNIEKFSQNTIELLQYYVYFLIDPRDSKVFYVGKGKDNRIFAHVNGLLSLSKSEQNQNMDLKYETIDAIQKQGLQVLHYIVRHNLTEQEAFLVESVLIDVFSTAQCRPSDVLTNKVLGHQHSAYGIATAEEIELMYAAEKLDLSTLQHSLLAININRLFDKEDKSGLYDATRQFWRLSPANANKVDFVAAEYRGLIRALYKVDKKGWQKSKKYKGRYFFEGEEVTDPDIQMLYLHKIIEKTKGASNPIRYFMKPE